MITMLPVIIPLALLGMLGAVGNVWTLFFFARCNRSSTVIFILCLAGCDLIVCVLIVPKVIELSMIARNTHTTLCKTTHFLAQWAIFCSCGFVMTIAVDRHRKICKSFKEQLSYNTSRWVAIVIVMVSMVLAVKMFFLTDTVDVRLHDPDTNQTTHGHYCTTSSDLGTVGMIFDSGDCLGAVILWFTIGIAYCQIIHRLIKLQRKRETRRHLSGIHRRSKRYSRNCSFRGNRKSSGEVERYIQTITINMQKIPGRESLRFRLKSRTELCPRALKRSFSEQDVLSIVDDEHAEVRGLCAETGNKTWNHKSVSEGDLLTIDKNVPEKNSIHNTITRAARFGSEDSITSMCWSVPTDVEQRLTFNTKRRKRRRAKHTSGKENRMTLMLFMVSGLILLTFAPYIVIKLVLRQLLRYGAEFELQLPVQFAFSLVYLNSVFTPIMYLIFNSDFRQLVRCRGHVQTNVVSFYPNYIQ